MIRPKPNDRLIRLSLLTVALTAITVLAVITIFIFEQGLPIMVKYGLKNFSFWPGLVSIGKKLRPATND